MVQIGIDHLIQYFMGKGTLDKIFQHNIQSDLENIQRQRLYHVLGRVPLMIDGSHCKKYPSCINMKPLLVQFEPISPHLLLVFTWVYKTLGNGLDLSIRHTYKQKIISVRCSLVQSSHYYKIIQGS